MKKVEIQHERCECGCICGLGAACTMGDDCECECHEADALTCYEIVFCCKQIKPLVDISCLGGMTRNQLFGWINHESEFTAAQKKTLCDLFFLRASEAPKHIQLPRDTKVPQNIATQIGNVQPIKVRTKALHTGSVDRHVETDFHKVIAIAKKTIVKQPLSQPPAKAKAVMEKQCQLVINWMRNKPHPKVVKAKKPPAAKPKKPRAKGKKLPAKKKTQPKKKPCVT